MKNISKKMQLGLEKHLLMCYTISKYGGIMSKQLIKILAICALVILCPVVIIAVSIMATEAVGVTLTISDGGVETLNSAINDGQGYEGKDSKVTIMIDGKEQTSNKVTVTKHTEVTVTYEGVGYDFVGWYAGNYNEINRTGSKVDDAVSTLASYTFEVSKNTVLTAVRDVKVYNVTYAGLYDDGETAMDLQPETLEYNQPLQTITPKVGGISTGWYNTVEGVAGTTTQVANFETSGNVEVYPAWEAQMLVEYLKGNQVISSIRLFEGQVEGYNLLDATSEVVKNNITPGYEFAGWTNQLGGEAVTTITYDANGIKLLLNESLITYTVNVKFNAVSDEVETLTYDVQNGLSTYAVTRDNYTFAGFDLGGVIYTPSQEEFSQAIIATGVKTVDVTAVWECNYPSGIAFTFKGLANYTLNGFTGNFLVYGDKGDEQGVKLSYDAEITNFEDNETGFDVNTNLYNYFVSTFENIKTKNGDAVEFSYISLTTYVNDNPLSNIIDITDGEALTITYANIFEYVKEMNAGTLDDVTEIKLQFMFEVIA